MLVFGRHGYRDAWQCVSTFVHATRGIGSIPKFLQNSIKRPWLVPKLRLWNVIVSEALLLITGSISFLHNCVPMGTRMMDLQKFGNVPSGI